MPTGRSITTCTRTISTTTTFSFGLAVWLVASHALADRTYNGNPADLPVFGWVENVNLVDADIELKAKLDSGAKTSSLDATDIEVFKKGERNWVRFTVTDPDTGEQVTLEKKRRRVVRIVRHSGNHQRRSVVDIDVCLGDQLRTIQVSLIDRSEFIYPMLIGRRALEGFALLDPGATFQQSPDCYDQIDNN